MTRKRWDESELLALVEDRLEPARAASLRTELASEPATLARLDGMRLDRQLLASAGEPAFPAELTADIDRLAARPMLVESTAAQWRRANRRPSRRGWALAAAAALVLAAGAGWWMVENRAAPKGLSSESGAMLVLGEGSAKPESGVDNPRVASPDTWPPADSTIYHRLPVMQLTDRRGPIEAFSGDREQQASGAAANPVMIPAPFALVVRVSNREQAMLIMREAARQLGEQTALVKNVTYRDVEEEIAQAVASLAGEPESPARAEASGSLAPAPSPVGSAVSAPSRRSRPGGAQPAKANLLEGPGRLGAPLEAQLEFSDGKRGWGAELTLSVPLSRLNQALEYLQLTQGQATTLRAIRPGTDGEAAPVGAKDGAAVGRVGARASGDASWISQVESVRAELDRLRQSDPRAIILVPIVFEP